MDSVLQDCRYAVRMLVNKPGFSAIAVLLLSLGIGANTSIFTLTNSLLLRPIVAEAPDELVALYSKDVTRPDSYRSFSYPNYEDIRAGNNVFSSLFAHDLTAVGLNAGDTTHRIFAEFASHEYLATFGVEPFRGRFFTPAETIPEAGIPVVVVSHEYWRKNGQDPELVGKTVQVNGQALTIVGIAPRHFTGRTAMISPAVYLPFGLHHLLLSDMFVDRAAKLSDRDNHRVLLVGRLLPGVAIEDAEARLAVLWSRLAEAHPEINGDQAIILGPLSRMGISTNPDNGDQQVALVALMLLGMTGIVLLIACLNLANMMLARGAARRREFAIRAAIGGGRARLVRQLLTEGLLLSALGSLGGLGIAYVANTLLARSMGQLLASSGLSMDLVLEAAPDSRVLLATAGFCVAGTLLFAFGPAWRQSRADVMGDLKKQSGAVGHARGGPLRGSNVLIVGQVALSLVLLTAAGLFIRGAMRAAEVAPGFDLDHGVLVELDPGVIGYDEATTRELYPRLEERLRAMPGIESVSLAATVPFGSVSSGQRVRRAEDLPAAMPDGSDAIESVPATFNIVGSEYFEALDIGVLRGRAFTVAESTSGGGPRVAIVDDVLAARLWPGEDPVGRQIGFGREPSARDGGDLEVVGVVDGVRDDLFGSEEAPHVYVPYGQRFQTSMFLHLRVAPTANAAAVAGMLGQIRQEIRGFDAELPVISLKPLRTHVMESASVWLVGLGATIFTVFGAVALLLAVVGVYGTKAYTVAQRTREIGVRKALGATAGQTVGLLVRESLKLTLVGLGIGILGAVGVAQVLASLLYEVSALDPVAFVVAPVILAAASLVATYLPARRAASIAPVTALRSD